jgi:hypothetical protein
MPVKYVKAKVTTPSHIFAARFKVSPCSFGGHGFCLSPPHSEMLWSVFVRGYGEKNVIVKKFAHRNTKMAMG